MEKISFEKLFPQLNAAMNQQQGGFMKWLQTQEWYQQLPDETDDRPEFCRGCRGIETCDRTGNLLENGRARRCPRAYGFEVGIRLTPEYEFLHTRMIQDHWEGWPVSGFQQTREKPNFIQTESFQSAEKLFYAIRGGANPGKNQAAIIACGRSGRGKTMSGLILLTECANAGMECYALRFNRLIEAMKRGRDGWDAIDEYYRRIADAQVVLVDEAGKELQGGNPDHVRHAIEKIVDLCYRQRFLFLTSNMTKKELGTYFTAAVFSRMRMETGYCRTVEESIQNPDLRGSGL